MNKQKVICYLLLLVVTSCASKKQLAVQSSPDESVDKVYQALQMHKSEFFANDSANAIVRDLGWAERLISGAKFTAESLPIVFRGNEHGFSVELPCWEMDSEEYRAANVIVEHGRIDSALILAKIQGVDELLMKSESRITYHSNDSTDWHTDSITFESSYEEIMRKARFSCVCIAKNKKKYIVNATIRVPNRRYLDEDKVRKYFNEDQYKEL